MFIESGLPSQVDETFCRIDYDTLVAQVSQALAAAGVPGPNGAVEAEIMVEADLMEVPSHGVRMLPGLLAAIQAGHISPAPRLVLRQGVGNATAPGKTAATCVLDCDNGPGRHTSLQAMQEAMKRAGHHGVGVCLATNVSHWGRAHAYASRAAQAGFIGICATNAMTSILGLGARRPILGNNPLAIGVPRGGGWPPAVLDIAMSQAAVGKIGTYQREGRAAPLGWGLDGAGNPTSDPAAIQASGNYLPMGGHKGAGLAFMIELMTGALAAGPLCFEMAARRSGGLDAGSSKLFIALQPAAFSDAGQFAARVEDLITHVRSAAEPGQTIFYPGERGWLAREKNLLTGVPLHPDIVAALEAVGVRLT